MLASAALNTSSCDSVRIPPKLTEVVKAILEFFFLPNAHFIVIKLSFAKNVGHFGPGL